MDVRLFPLWTALITPFNNDMSVDYESLERLVHMQGEAGNGLLVLGSTGEGLNIDLETKKKIVKFIKGLDPVAPIMVGVGGHTLSAQKEWVQWLETQDIHAYLMVVPIYAKPGVMGQIEWFRALMDEVTRPVMLYNVPGRTGKELEFKAVEKLIGHENFWAIKEASGSLEKFKQYLKASDNAMVYCGDDALFPEFAAHGSSGLVSVAANPWPHQTYLYVEQCLEGNFDASGLWSEAAERLFIASNPIPAKRLMLIEEKISSDLLMPPLSNRDLEDNAALRDASRMVNEWYMEEIS